MEHTGISPQPPFLLQTDAPLDRAAAIAHHMAALEQLAEPRDDGWTPFCRKLFMSVLAETGRVTAACDTCRLSKQSAYALRARDPIFAVGWDAACELARIPLADALYEQALDGITDTITRDDGHTITRHRHDGRLSIAVLNRLDRRCDRAAETGSAHLGAVAHWDEFMAAVGEDDSDAAAALLAAWVPAKLSQASQPAAPHGVEVERVWWDEKLEEWRTDFPAPLGFTGFVADEDDAFQRELTPAELAIVQRSCDANDQAECEEGEADRDIFFAALAAEVEGDEEEEEMCVPAKGTHQSTTLMGPKAGTQSGLLPSQEHIEAPSIRLPGLDPGSACLTGPDEEKADPGQACPEPVEGPGMTPSHA